MKIRVLIIISMFIVLLSSCSANKTVYVSNKTGNTIILSVDSSYSETYPIAFRDSINGLKIVDKKVFNFGKGKWTNTDKTNLEKLIKHTKIMRDGSTTKIKMPGKTKVSHISLDVEELWIRIK